MNQKTYPIVYDQGIILPAHPEKLSDRDAFTFLEVHTKKLQTAIQNTVSSRQKIMYTYKDIYTNKFPKSRFSRHYLRIKKNKASTIIMKYIRTKDFSMQEKRKILRLLYQYFAAKYRHVASSTQDRYKSYVQAVLQQWFVSFTYMEQLVRYEKKFVQMVQRLRIANKKPSIKHTYEQMDIVESIVRIQLQYTFM